jgi:hypothetical protein
VGGGEPSLGEALDLLMLLYGCPIGPGPGPGTVMRGPETSGQRAYR